MSRNVRRIKWKKSFNDKNRALSTISLKPILASPVVSTKALQNLKRMCVQLITIKLKPKQFHIKVSHYHNLKKSEESIMVRFLKLVAFLDHFRDILVWLSDSAIECNYRNASKFNDPLGKIPLFCSFFWIFLENSRNLESKLSF